MDTLRRAAEFAAIRPFIPVTRVCLLDSLALVRLVGRTDASVRLVFGVTGLPFSAHCWVQTDDRLLNDHPDVVARYAPILHLGL